MNQRDVELLSAYLDGQLKPSDSARLESRLSSDPNLRAVLDDLHSARSLLRQLPQRRAPRNFTLTRKMVGQNPPMPRAYPVFRFATALATLLFFFTVGLNFVAPQLAPQAPALGMGGGGGPKSFAAEAPAATEAPALAVTAAPAEPSTDLAPLPTPMPTFEDSARTAETTPAAKSGETGNGAAQELLQVQNAPPLISSAWQIVLAVIAVAGAVFMLLMRRFSINRWREK